MARRPTSSKKVGIVIPTRAGDEWRARALAFVREWYADKHPEIPVVLGELDPDEEWSKGAAVAAGVAALGPVDVLVLADADSFVTDPRILADAVELVRGGRPWVVPHHTVYRLRESETERLYSDPTRRPRMHTVARTPYVGPAGGGITVVSAEAFELVRGVDRRFLGWGGEDVAFGWALETLTAPVHRLTGRLCHLWHPHPAPNLRGSPASEELIARYRDARGYPRRMTPLVAGEEWETLPALDEPVRFRMTANRRTLRLFGSDLVIRFRDGIYETRDPDEADALRRHTIIREERRR
jgi:hypothetical protein